MSNYNIPILSDAEEVKILYNLKTITSEYRRTKNAALLPDLLTAFDKAASIGLQESNELKKIFSDVTMGAKAYVLSKVQTENYIKKLPKDKLWQDVVRADDIDSVNVLIDAAAELEKQDKEIQKKLKALEKQNGGKKADLKTSAKTVVAEDTEFVKQLKAEAAAAISKNKLLSDEEKKERLALLEKTPALKVKFKAPKCSIIYDNQTEPAETMLAIGLIMDGKSSRYAQISKESLAEFANISSKGKEFKTALGQEQKSAQDAVKKATKKAEAEEEKRQKQIADLKLLAEKNAKMKIENKEKIFLAIKNLIKNLEPRAMFAALADPDKASQLVAYLLQDKHSEAVCSATRNILGSSACGNKNVWSLFMEDKDKNNTDSYYLKKIQALRPQTEVNASVKLFAEQKQIDEKHCKIEILKLAGTVLPKSVAEDLFMQGMFNYGMAMSYRDKYDPEKFNQMNQVLDLFGYQIKLLPIKAEQAAEKGSQEFSKLILDDMHRLGHKGLKSKKLALMYKIGALIDQNPNKEFNDINESEHIQKLYKDFCAIFFDEKNSSTTNPLHKHQWDAFLKNKKNREYFDQTFKFFSSNAESSKQLNQWISRLSAGEYINDESSIVQQSTHHIYYRRYAGIVKSGRELFNAQDNLAQTICMHPADNDPHKETHKFDAKELYLIKRGEEFLTCAISAIKEGDIVYMTEVCKKDSQGNYKPIIEHDDLLVTQNFNIREPFVMKNAGPCIEKNLTILDGR